MPGITGLFMLFVFSYVFWRYIKWRLFTEKQADTNNYNQEVVGEASYLKNLKSIAANGTNKGRITGLTAVLTPEPDNKYDSNAVRVDINGLQVGYLPAPTAKKHIKANKGTINCPAVIFGGEKDKPNYGVWLAYP